MASKHDSSGIAREIRGYQGKGMLVPDNVVANALLDALDTATKTNTPFGAMDVEDTEKSKSIRAGFMLDGFPRNISQAKLMESPEWPEHLKVDYAISIDVPDIICKRKILGRRKCVQCNTSFNLCGVHGVGGIRMYHHEDILSTPSDGSSVDELGQAGSTDNGDNVDLFTMEPMLLSSPCPCDKNETWKIRNDDTEEIVDKRLADFHVESNSILNFYERRGRLIRFLPHLGVDDLPKLVDLIRDKFQ